MTTLVEARDAVISFVNTTLTTGYPSVPVYYENTKAVDMVKAPDTFIRVSMDYQDNSLITVDNTYIDRLTGEVNLRFFCREGTGTRGILAIIDYTIAALRHQTVSGVHLETPTPGRKIEADGWLVQDLNIPFFFDSVP